MTLTSEGKDLRRLPLTGMDFPCIFRIDSPRGRKGALALWLGFEQREEEEEKGEASGEDVSATREDLAPLLQHRSHPSLQPR